MTVFLSIFFTLGIMLMFYIFFKKGETLNHKEAKINISLTLMEKNELTQVTFEHNMTILSQAKTKKKKNLNN